MTVRVRGLNQDGVHQFVGQIMERLIRIVGRADTGPGSGRPPGRLARVHGDEGLPTLAFPAAQTPDKDDVVSRRRAIKAIDTQADPPWPKGFAIDGPCRITILERQARCLKALVGDPERDRLDGDGDIDGDGRIDVEAEIAPSQGRTLMAVKPRKNQLFSGRNDAEVVFGIRPAQATTDGLQRLLCGHSMFACTRVDGSDAGIATDEEAGNQCQTDPSVRPRDFHDTRSLSFCVRCKLVSRLGRD